jgi:hypothetical protein
MGAVGAKIGRALVPGGIVTRNTGSNLLRLLAKFCGKFLNDAGIFLTDIAFPGQETKLDQIRSSRRPTTRTGRGKLPK